MLSKSSTLFKILPFVFLLFLLFLPSIADGFALDLAIMQLEAVSEKTGPLKSFVYTSFIALMLGVVLFWVSTSLLQAVIEATPEALTVMGGDTAEIVQVGWNFTVGIGNMLLVIAFLVIAISTILGYENFKFQKLLPRLVIIALLMNFTLLFVGAAIDISNFLFNSIGNQFSPDGEGRGILWDAVQPILTMSGSLVTDGVIVLSAMAISMLVPYLNVAVQVAWVVGIIALIPFIVQFLVTGIILILLSLVFLLYFLIFIARIFVIQILAVIAPLAFLCLLFDETKQYWRLWVKHLIQWLLVGVVFIFLMYLGLLLAPLSGEIMHGFFDDQAEGVAGMLGSYFVLGLVSHIVLLVYFIVLVFILKSTIPAAAGALIAQGSALVKSASPYIGAIGKGSKQRYQSKIADNEKMQKTMGQWTTETHTPTGNTFKDALGNMKSSGKRAIGGALGPGTKEAEKKSLENEVAKLKGKPKKIQAKAFEDAKAAPPGDTTAGKRKLAATLAAKGDGNIDYLKENTSFDSKDMSDLIKKSRSVGNLKGVKEALPVEYLAHENKGLSYKEQEKNTQKFLAEVLKGKAMEENAPQIVDAINKGTAEQKAQGAMLLSAIVKSSDHSNLENLVKGAPGAQGAEVVHNHLDMVGSAKYGASPGDKKARYNTLLAENPELAKQIAKNLSKYSLDIRTS